MKIRTQHRFFIFLTAFFIFSFSLFVLFSSGMLESEDGWLYSSVARNIYYNHQIASAPYEYPQENVHMNTTLSKDGTWKAPGSLGYSLSLVPAVALSDLMHRAYGATPPIHFPLEHDWSFHMFASFTNAFWGALLAIFILLYALELKFTLKKSFLIAICSIVTTNLLPLTKFSFAHVMFTTCLMACFYFIKRYTVKHQLKFFFLAGLSFLILKISYNVTYYLPIIPLCLYLLALEKPLFRKRIGFLMALGVVLFAWIFPARFANIIQSTHMSPKVLFEGVWGFIFSSGKSIFLYSPPLILIPLFWHKLKKEALPEIIAAASLLFVYLYLIGSASITDHGLAVPIWHGGMAWGPRYLAPVIPLGMILVFYIISNLNALQKRFIVIPIFVLGFWIQLVGTSLIYLLQYRDIPYNVFIGGAELTVYDYASFIPRYSPLITLSSSLIANIKSFPSTIDHGPYQVKFFDGFDIPYQTGNGAFRGFRQEGYISFVNMSKDPVVIDLSMFNAPDTATSSAGVKINVSVNEKELAELSLAARAEKTLSLNFTAMQGKPTLISLKAEYDGPLVTPHVVYIKKMTINGQAVNLASLDYPEVSTLGRKNSPIPYRYFGNKLNQNWKSWDRRARINERTLDFWWIKNLYYWDRPQRLIFGLFIFDTVICLASGVYLYRLLRRQTTHA